MTYSCYNIRWTPFRQVLVVMVDGIAIKSAVAAFVVLRAVTGSVNSVQRASSCDSAFERISTP